jgi:hypothetical protein
MPDTETPNWEAKPADEVFRAQVASVSRRASEAGIPIGELCKEAGASAANISRWGKNVPSGIKVLRKLQTALDNRLEAKAAEAATA